MSGALGISMTVFDLLFIVVFLLTTGMLAAATVAAIRHGYSTAVSRLRTLALFLAGYLTLVVLASVLSPAKVVPIGQAQCFDDWCISVDSIQRTQVTDGSLYDVGLTLHSRARGRAQRENGVSVHVLDEHGRTHAPVVVSDDIPLNVMLAPGETVMATRRFYLPRDARNPGLVVAHGRLPGLFIIGDEQSLLHKPSVTPFQ